MWESTLERFFRRGQVGQRDAALVRWSHAVNRRSHLMEALTGPSHMIEADVILRGHEPNEPVMAHPPETDGDITLREWLQEIKGHDKGIKLDIKSPQALAPAVELLQVMLTQLTGPVWFNADVLPGPGGRTPLLEPHHFLSVATALPVQCVLSLGWTTGWTPGAENPGYSWAMVQAMENVSGTLEHEVTFPVRAALLPQSLPQLDWLLTQSDRYSLTVWMDPNDSFTSDDLLLYRRRFDVTRIYWDLQEDVRKELLNT